MKVQNVATPYGIIGHHLKERYITLHYIHKKNLAFNFLINTESFLFLIGSFFYYNYLYVFMANYIHIYIYIYMCVCVHIYVIFWFLDET